MTGDGSPPVAALEANGMLILCVPGLVCLGTPESYPPALPGVTTPVTRVTYPRGVTSD